MSSKWNGTPPGLSSPQDPECSPDQPKFDALQSALEMQMKRNLEKTDALRDRLVPCLLPEATSPKKPGTIGEYPMAAIEVYLQSLLRAAINQERLLDDIAERVCF